VSPSGPELTVSHTPEPATTPVRKMLDALAQQPTTVPSAASTLAGTCTERLPVTQDTVPLTVADTLDHVILNVSAVLDQKPTTASGVYLTQLVTFTDTAAVMPTGQD
jgi:hypothetical protein